MCVQRLVGWVLSFSAVLVSVGSGTVAAADRLFPTDLTHNQWVRFDCAGFSAPVTGVIFGPEAPSCCGVPLGGVATGCLDVEVGGVLGFDTIFNGYPRHPQRLTPFLGIAIGGKTTVLADKKYTDGGTIVGCTEPHEGAQPYKQRSSWATHLTRLTGVTTPRKIHYFGHYPVADYEYELEGPIRVGMRAWSPFLPGHTGASNIPAAVFEVRLRNESGRPQNGTLAFSYPDIPQFAVLHSGDHLSYQRQRLTEPVQGVAVSGPNQIGYVLGLIGDQNLMLWAAPAAVIGTDMAGPVKPGALVDRIIESGRP